MFPSIISAFLTFLTCLHIRDQVSGFGSPAMATIEFIKILIFVLLAIDYAAIMCMTMYSAMNFFVFPYPTFFIPLTYLVYWFVIVRVTYSWSTSTLVLRQMVSRPFGVISTNGLLAVMITATIHLIYFNYSLGYFIATFNFNEYPSKSHPLSSRSSIQWWLGMSCTFLIIHDLCTLSLLMVSYKYWVNLVAFLNQDQPRNNGESKESNNFQQQPILYYPPQQEYGGSPTDRYNDQLQFNGYTHPVHAQPQPQIIQHVIILPPRPVMISINSPSLPPRSDAMVSRSNPPPLPQRSELTSVASISFTSPQLPPRPLRKKTDRSRNF